MLPIHFSICNTWHRFCPYLYLNLCKTLHTNRHYSVRKLAGAGAAKRLTRFNVLVVHREGVVATWVLQQRLAAWMGALSLEAHPK